MDEESTSLGDREGSRVRRGARARGAARALFAGALLLCGTGRAATTAPTAPIPPRAASDIDRSERLQREALAGDGAFALVRALTTEVGNRFSGTPGDRTAIAWCEARARAIGLPKVWTEPVTVPRWVRGGASGAIVAPWPQTVALLALGGSEGTPAEGIEAEVVAAESVEALEKLPPELVRGRIVFLTKRMRRTPEGTGYGETVPIRSRGPVVAGRLGAAALLIRSVATDSNRLAHTGAIRWEEGSPRIPAAALSVPDAELLERELASGQPVRFRLTLGARMEGEAESANVLAEIPGSARPDEIVLLVAHRDSWDVGTGAQDNGTGVALVLEAARLIQSAGAPRRTVRVLLTANEEFGLSGARAYAAAHAAELPRHVLAIEMDSGAGRAVRLLTRFAAADAGAAGELAARLEPLGIVPASEPASGGADLIPVAPAGVPLVDLDQDRSLYFDIHHTENDTLDKIDPADLRQLTAALVTVADWAAQRPERLAVAPVDPEAKP